MRIEGPVLLYGAGKEARSSLAFLGARYPGLEFFVTADTGRPELPGAEFAAPEDLDPARFGLIVKSPGVPLYVPFFVRARGLGVRVTSNVNLWAAHYREGRKLIAISGTKGKSTTATLVAMMLEASGVDAVLAGNVGLPPLDAADRAGTVVLELSSYQTADMDFAPDIAALTTLYPEHVDWHGGVERYYADKLNLIAHGAGGLIALGAQAYGVPEVRAALPATARLLPPLGPELDMTLAAAVELSRLKGAHNLDNARLAAGVALAAGASLEGVLHAIAAFRPLPHRLEEIKIGGYLFVDDSISTTPEATKAALAAYGGRRIALIAGGYERGQDYAELANLLDPHGVVMLCCLPVTGTRLARAARGAAPHIPVAECPTLETALQTLAQSGRGFDTVILSPGAPSYNQFRNFEERGDTFKRLARSHFGIASPG